MDAERLEPILREATGAPKDRLVSLDPVGGGDIADSRMAIMDSGRRWFIKRQRDGVDCPGMFPAEAMALERLAAPDVIRVPRPVYASEDLLIMEAFQPGRAGADWQEQMGRQLALLHQATRQRQYGFDCGNWLGFTPQPNPATQDWVTFWRESRLGHQLSLYARGADADDPVLRLGDQLMNRLEERLSAPDEPAVLLHGDLWSGNAAADEGGAPVIFDPASYYGHREAEFGMMRLFGGFSSRCEEAYREVWPLAPGYDERIPVYRLYHELNHLNLFGSVYHAKCLATLRSLL